MDQSLFPVVPVLLERASLEQRWGFRLQGGANFRLPLSVKKIIPNSPSHNKLYPGDGLAFIDGRDTNEMKHEDAMDLMRTSLRIQLILRRGQLNVVRPTQATVKFTAGPPTNQRANSALYNTKTPNNYRRF